MMAIYRYGHTQIISELDLPELRTAGEYLASTVPVIRVQRELDGLSGFEELRHAWPTEQSVDTMLLLDITGGYRLRFLGVADFDVGVSDMTVTVSAPITAHEAMIRHLLLDHVIPRLLSHCGDVVLHAAAVATQDGAVLLVGESGIGKSTLAGSFNGTRGTSLLSDDGVIVTAVDSCHKVFPLYNSLRLYPGSIDVLYPDDVKTSQLSNRWAKQRILQSSGLEDPSVGHPVAGIFRLEPQKERTQCSPISTTQLGPQDAYFTVLRNTFQLDPTDTVRAARLMGQVGDIVSNVPVYRLVYPHNYERLPDVRAAVQGILGPNRVMKPKFI